MKPRFYCVAEFFAKISQYTANFVNFHAPWGVLGLMSCYLRRVFDFSCILRIWNKASLLPLAEHSSAWVKHFTALW